MAIKDQTTFKQLQDLVANNTSAMTIHGLSSLIRANNYFVKIIHLIFFLLSISFCLFQIYITFADYWKFHVITQIEEIDLTNETFPAIFICKKRSEELGELEYSSSRYCTDEKEYITRRIKDVRINIKNKRYRCLTVNSKIEKNETLIDSKRCLKFRLKTKSEEDQPLIFVANNRVKYFEDRQKYVDLDSGYQYYVSMKKTVEHKLSRPSFKCSGKTHYRLANCLSNCIEEVVKSDYNCSITMFSRWEIREDCRDLKNRSRIVNFALNDCRANCLPECNTDNYDLSYSKTYDGTNNNRIRFSVFFEKDSYTRNTQLLKTNLNNLMSNVGGLLGLCLGMSFLSFVEIIQFIMEIIYFLIKKVLIFPVFRKVY